MKKVSLCNFARGRRQLIFVTDKTESKERSQCEIVKWKYVSRCDEQTKTTCLIRPRGDVRNTIGTEWRRLKYI